MLRNQITYFILLAFVGFIALGCGKKENGSLQSGSSLDGHWVVVKGIQYGQEEQIKEGEMMLSIANGRFQAFKNGKADTTGSISHSGSVLTIQRSGQEAVVLNIIMLSNEEWVFEDPKVNEVHLKRITKEERDQHLTLETLQNQR